MTDAGFIVDLDKRVPDLGHAVHCGKDDCPAPDFYRSYARGVAYEARLICGKVVAKDRGGDNEC